MALLFEIFFCRVYYCSLKSDHFLVSLHYESLSKKSLFVLILAFKHKQNTSLVQLLPEKNIYTHIHA